MLCNNINLFVFCIIYCLFFYIIVHLIFLSNNYKLFFVMWQFLSLCTLFFYAVLLEILPFLYYIILPLLIFTILYLLLLNILFISHIRYFSQPCLFRRNHKNSVWKEHIDQCSMCHKIPLGLRPITQRFDASSRISDP